MKKYFGYTGVVGEFIIHMGILHGCPHTSSLRAGLKKQNKVKHIHHVQSCLGNVWEQDGDFSLHLFLGGISQPWEQNIVFEGWSSHPKEWLSVWNDPAGFNIFQTVKWISQNIILSLISKFLLLFVPYFEQPQTQEKTQHWHWVQREEHRMVQMTMVSRKRRGSDSCDDGNNNKDVNMRIIF